MLNRHFAACSIIWSLLSQEYNESINNRGFKLCITIMPRLSILPLQSFYTRVSLPQLNILLDKDITPRIAAERSPSVITIRLCIASAIAYLENCWILRYSLMTALKLVDCNYAQMRNSQLVYKPLYLHVLYYRLSRWSFRHFHDLPRMDLTHYMVSEPPEFSQLPLNRLLLQYQDKLAHTVTSHCMSAITLKNKASVPLLCYCSCFPRRFISRVHTPWPTHHDCPGSVCA